MAKKQKVCFGDLKPGQKFRYKRKLYVLDSYFCNTRLSNGDSHEFIDSHELVTPVKVKITVV